MADDLGFSDLGCYGGEIETPNLDGLARDGLRFSRFYNNALCVPTRASLLTGLYPEQIAPGPLMKLSAGNHITLAELLRGAGYRTLMVGKWHNGNHPDDIPCARGFDRYWGLLSGCSNYFNPGLPREGEPAPAHKKEGDMRTWGADSAIIHPFTPQDGDFYTTDVFTEKALGFLEQYGREERPFFLYLAHCAPHFPMQAWPEDIEKYRGSYLEGWETLRQRRYQRILDLGLFPHPPALSPCDSRSPAWDQVEDKDAWDLKMAVYAAMVDRMDQGIGRVLSKLRELGKEEDTLVLFLSDNGGCGGSIDRSPEVPPGPVNSYHTVDAPWANLSNTPFRLFKIFDHEGGISTPLIARWPRVIREGGGMTHHLGHILDFMPTFAELAGAIYPTKRNGKDILPPEGHSLVPALLGEGPVERGPLFWRNEDCRAVLDGRWKLVTEGPERELHQMTMGRREGAWELYDTEADRCELNNLADQFPEKARVLESLWLEWRQRCESARENFARD